MKPNLQEQIDQARLLLLAYWRRLGFVRPLPSEVMEALRLLDCLAREVRA